MCFSRALPPPAHHASARPVLATHPTHPLPAHMQPAAVFPAHPQVAASYGFAPLSPAKSHQYQPSLWFTEWESSIAQMDPTWNSRCCHMAVELFCSWYGTTRSSAEHVCFLKHVPINVSQFAFKIGFTGLLLVRKQCALMFRSKLNEGFPVMELRLVRERKIHYQITLTSIFGQVWYYWCGNRVFWMPHWFPTF